MPDRVYSLYQAKAQFSKILRAVREGKTVTISYHGEPVAEIRPIGSEAESIERRVERLTERGVLVRADRRMGRLVPVARKPGALKRFLAEREE